MSSFLKWSIVDAQTRAANSYNDDAYGFTSQRLWVIDGATGISDVRCTAHASDAAWLAECTSTLLHQIAQAPLGLMLQALQAQVKAAFSQAVKPNELEHLLAVDMPCACIGLVAVQKDHMEIACVGDISIVVAAPGEELQVFSDGAAASFSDKTLTHWRQLLAEHGAPEKAWPFLRATIRANRAAVNMPQGYTVIHPTLDWAHRVTVHRLPVVPGMRVLLASDGVWRLVDLFGTHDADSLLDAVTKHHWSPIMDQLRQLEKSDQDCSVYLRVKPSDDATGLLAFLEDPMQ